MTDFFNPQSNISPKVLATDLDGTVIPPSQGRDDSESLQAITRPRAIHGFGLIYVTGRPTDSVLEAIEDFDMPRPDWILSDVGTTIHKRAGESYEPFENYQQHLLERTQQMSRETVEDLLRSVEGMQLQSAPNQKRFKISYECDPDQTDARVAEISHRLAEAKLPFTCLGSLDPFENRGLLDVLPANVSKAYALLWLSTHADFLPDEVIFAGDSGNDLAALSCGFRAIVVSNATDGLADAVRQALLPRGLEDRLYTAKQQATSGVLEGCIHFGLVEGRG